MANVFAILSAIALAAALFLANKNKDAYDKEIHDRVEADGKLEKEKKNLATLTSRFTETETERKSTEGTVEDLKGTEATAKKNNDAAEKTKATKTTDSDANEKKIASIQQGLGDANEISELANKMKRTSEELASLTDEIASNNATLADLVGEKGRTEGVIGGMRKKNSDISNKISFFSSASISAIYPTFGFVTIPVGANAGVVPGSTLNVVRGGSVVGKLRVRSVEASRASADIIPDSLAEDTTLSVGDKVVPATDAPTAAGAKPAAK
jgi:hypothetical protein